jgi:iron complex outermembrane receptor protein
VAIGYGTQTRKEITGSVANVTEESFNKGVTRDATDLLQGKVAGLVITSGSGDVTRGNTMRLRGTSTLQNDQGPLIVIDGVPGGDMSTVSPSDIESISVLKDASSAAIYGSRSAGGVVLITTKRGSGSKTMISYDGYVAMDQMVNKPDLMNADQWRAYANSKSLDTSTYDLYGADTDWFDEMTRTGVSQNHSVSMSGGGSKSNYRASFSYLDRNGIMRDNAMERYSFRFQFSQRAINDRLKIGLTGSATLTDNQVPNGR